jgi:hypothetical protein
MHDGQDTGTSTATAAAELPALTDVWGAVAGRLTAILRDGRSHLLTADVLRWQAIDELIGRGVRPSALEVDVVAESIQSNIDLVLHSTPPTAIELRCPGDGPGRGATGAADAATLGELLRDVYRLGAIDGYGERWAVMFLNYRLCQYLARRSRWTFEAGTWIEFGPEGFALLPQTTAGGLEAWRDATVTAECVVAEHTEGHRLVAYRVTGPNQMF